MLSQLPRRRREHALKAALPGLQPEVLPRLTSALGRLAEPQELAAAVAPLTSPDASDITGSTLAVDGGQR
jgi:NAD(P)-dependent dehydrogenase (short-subunit alcohol dehydrogenase family)